MNPFAVPSSVSCARWGWTRIRLPLANSSLNSSKRYRRHLSTGVVLDVQMPGLNGLEVQERLMRGGYRFPVIFITAHDEVGVREQARAAGNLAFVRKPFNDSESLNRGVGHSSKMR